MSSITVIHHREPNSAWADSPDIPGWTAVGKDRLEVLRLANEGVPYFLGQDDLDIRHEYDDNNDLVVGSRITSTPTWKY